VSLIVFVCREHESFDVYSVRIPEANETSRPIPFVDSHIENKGLGTAGFTNCLCDLNITFAMCAFSVNYC